jgi:hypothetical protein
MIVALCARAPKDRRRDETLAGFRMRRRERLRQRDTDRARGDVDPTLRQTINDAAFAEHHALDGVVVCQHGDNGTRRQASAILATALAPCAISGSAFAGVRL